MGAKSLDNIDVCSMTVVKLRDECRTRGLKVGGTKSELVERLTSHIASMKKANTSAMKRSRLQDASRLPTLAASAVTHVNEAVTISATMEIPPQPTMRTPPVATAAVPPAVSEQFKEICSLPVANISAPIDSEEAVHDEKASICEEEVKASGDDEQAVPDAKMAVHEEEAKDTTSAAGDVGPTTERISLVTQEQCPEQVAATESHGCAQRTSDMQASPVAEALATLPEQALDGSHMSESATFTTALAMHALSSSMEDVVPSQDSTCASTVPVANKTSVNCGSRGRLRSPPASRSLGLTPSLRANDRSPQTMLAPVESVDEGVMDDIQSQDSEERLQSWRLLCARQAACFRVADASCERASRSRSPALEVAAEVNSSSCTSTHAPASFSTSGGDHSHSQSRSRSPLRPCMQAKGPGNCLSVNSQASSLPVVGSPSAKEPVPGPVAPSGSNLSSCLAVRMTTPLKSNEDGHKKTACSPLIGVLSPSPKVPCSPMPQVLAASPKVPCSPSYMVPMSSPTSSTFPFESPSRGIQSNMLADSKHLMLEKLTKQMQTCLARLNDDSLDDMSKTKYRNFVSSIKAQVDKVSDLNIIPESSPARARFGGC